MSTQLMPDGVLDALKAREYPCLHPDAFVDQNGRAVRAKDLSGRAMTLSGFLSFGQYRSGYPVQNLEAVFYLYIDNIRHDNAYICLLDVVEDRERIIARSVLSRYDFAEAGKHLKFSVPFIVTSPQKVYEFRVFYIGAAYIAVDGVLVVDPTKISTFQLPGRVDDAPQTSPFPQPPQQGTGSCQGSEIVCIDGFTPEAVQRNQGIVHGGNFHDGAFTPSNRGGIEFNFDLDTNRKYVIEIELDGNIANSHIEDELGGGKVTLFEMHARNSSYFYTCQRMAHKYRGTGIFRTNPGHLITIADLSGYYSMSDWGDEPHTFTFEVNGRHHKMKIDRYTSRTERGLEPGGTLQMKFMFGNRQDRFDNQHCITNFRRLKIAYI